MGALTLLEVAANVLTAVSIALAALNRVHTWWTGIVGCVLFAVLFSDQRLYADALLQFFFIGASVIGWYQWLRGGPAGGERPVTRTPLRHLAWMAAAAVVVTLGYGALLRRWTDAAAPYPDSAVLALSVVGQLLLMHRRVETWPVWLLVNTVAVPLFASRGLLLTAALYAAYWFNAWYGWWRWRRAASRP